MWVLRTLTGLMRLFSIAAAAILATALLAGCKGEPRKTDAELGLNPQQARGRRVYEAQCERCHDPYSRWAVQGPSLKGLSHRQYLPSGMPVNDDRLSDVIMMGRAKMPSFRKTIGEQQLIDLLAYLKTL
jgi:mono/diheme cytochrome c family protein